MFRSRSFKIFYLVFFFGFIKAVFSQFQVEFNKIEGELSKADKYQINFGRYDGYEIPLYEGETVNFLVYSEKFSPHLIFVNPSGKIFKEAFPEKSNIASIITTVPESGNWIIYIVSDSSASGAYTFQFAVAAANSVKLNPNSDFCTTLSFIAAHAKAYFLLFELPIDSKQSFVKLNGALDAFIDESDGSYVAKFYEGNSVEDAEKIFNEVTNKISHCLGKTWNLKTKNWQSVEDYKIKGNLVSETTDDKGRYIQISLINFKNSKQKFIGDYVVQVEINRRN